MLRFALTSVNSKPAPMVAHTATSRAALQLLCTTTEAVTVDEMAPPIALIVFIAAESDAEYPGARSIHAAQKFAAANMLKPAANAIIGSATTVSDRWLPTYKRTAETPIPNQTAL